ncbi:hypothetical protein [Rugamonas apoptosis]|uniref:Uncharacterized protein n=1 Tax=Rugamonas apoptosis TaxID=2758570 RepID=A0A7W2F6J5_9BURK|nr:hypothetical protein [Rugamonas apoptosis]MBA5685919.1 hypothetical protein [Rugamonas apoptosis]
MSFFSSDIGVAIAWICTVGGFLYAFLQKKENSTLKLQLHQTQELVFSLQNSLNSMGDDSSQNLVNQSGGKNVYTKTNTGGMTINM